MFVSLFVQQNAEESIFELQFNGQENYDSKNGVNRGNRGVCEGYCHYDHNNTSIPYFYASSLFTKSVNEIWTEGGSVTDDYRRNNNTYPSDVSVGESTAVLVRKYVSTNTTLNYTGAPEAQRAYISYKQNYIVYRLTDVMLMKAEALTALATDSDAVLREAFTIAQTVNARSKVNEADSLVWDKYASGGKSAVENLVLAERLRELAFEGKRWYDLLRYNYRHVEGVDYDRILADQSSFVATNSQMLSLMTRKLNNGGAVAAKLGNESRLYMPVPLADLKICPALKQNPGYSSSDNYSKNY
jgi:hypothetical protein